MKKWVLIIAVIGYGVLVTLLHYSIRKSNEYARKLSIAESNIKSYDQLLDSSKNKSIVLQLTSDQMSYAKDSILKELEETRGRLKIKKKDVKSYQYVYSTFTKNDTIITRDTIFKEASFTLDTIIGDEWYNVKLNLKYPSTIVVNPNFKSDKNIIVHTKRETVNPPKKWWLLRLFQKKHTVLKIDVIEKNPYIQQENNRYIEIIK